ncbi:MAG: hypothetical protein JWM43_3611 [Acidobacteriaceae bacterium]|nr:hypothetical protein [Acidobacteriaceae bacterium]
MRTSFVLELHREWSEFADEYIGLLAAIEKYFRIARYPGVIQPFWSLDISSISPERQEFSK